jgi:CrcB protein
VADQRPTGADPPTVAAHRGQTLLAVFAGGALGTLARAALTRGLPHDPGAWPWSTFAVNLLGAFLLGWWATRLLRSPGADPRARPFLATGVCGGLTTFSTLQLELVDLLRDGAPGLAVAYATASVVLGLAAVLAGRTAARRGGGALR